MGCTPLITETHRREHLLMPSKGSEPFKQWVAEYGDTADSWELFTIDFHTKYISELDKRIKALTAAIEAYPDPNEIRSHWTEIDFTITSEDVALDPNATTTETN